MTFSHGNLENVRFEIKCHMRTKSLYFDKGLGKQQTTLRGQDKYMKPLNQDLNRFVDLLFKLYLIKGSKIMPHNPTCIFKRCASHKSALANSSLQRCIKFHQGMTFL